MDRIDQERLPSHHRLTAEERAALEHRLEVLAIENRRNGLLALIYGASVIVSLALIWWWLL